MEDDMTADSSSVNSTFENEALLSDLELDVAEELDHMTISQAWNLYTSHALSTWNMRMYEFAAIIFTAAAYPETLLAASIRGIVRTFAAICLSSSVGRWIDHSPNRLKTLTSTILINRLSIMAACALWFLVLSSEASFDHGILASYATISPRMIPKWFLFTAILILGIFETLSASGNTLSMERDWVVVASSPAGRPYDLTQLNSIMRRIDLICKLIAPVFISIIVSSTNVEVGVLVVGGLSACSFVIEWLCVKRVWDHNPRLRAPKAAPLEQSRSNASSVSSTSTRFWTRVVGFFQRYGKDFKSYFSSIVWIPSMALAILHISVLAYNATLITFLLNAGFSLDVITIARAAGSIVEISSTVVTPIGVTYLSKAKNHGRYIHQVMTAEETTILLEADAEVRGTEIGIFRLGLWGITWQLLNLVPVIFSLWFMSAKSVDSSHSNPNIIVSFTLFFFLSTSRLGLWIYDLTTQQLTQTMTIPSQRSSFAGVENSFVSFFELLQNIIIIILHKPEHFKFIAAMSWVAVAVSTIMYAGWVFKMRGHLVHWDTIMKSCECVKIRLGHER